MHGLIFRAQKEEVLVKKETVDVTTKGNYATASGYSTRIRNEEDFIRELEIDTDKWIIEKFKIKTWEGYRKDVDQMMDFDEGRITGYKHDHGGINTETLFSISAQMVRREPEPIHPIVSPVSVKVKYARPTKGQIDRSGRSLYIADPHFGFKMDPRGRLTPFHDRRALSIVLSLVKEFSFDNILLGGDTLDLAEWSTKFPRKPELFRTTQPAIYEGKWFLAQLRALAPHTNIEILEGNHDKRLQDYLVKHAYMALELRRSTEFNYDIMSVPYLLALEELDIKYSEEYPDGQVWIDDVLYIHGNIARGKSGATAAAVVADAQYTTAFGHIHRREMATRTVHGPRGPEEITAFTPGCLCHIDGRVPGSGKCNWQQGIAVITDAIPQLVPIVDGRALYNNKTYEAWDYLESLRADVDWNF